MARIRSIKPKAVATAEFFAEFHVIGCWLYRMYGADGRLLYVGISSGLPGRLRRHSHRKPWWGEVDRIELERFDLEHLALAAERRAIRSENPVYNVRSKVGA